MRNNRDEFAIVDGSDAFNGVAGHLDRDYGMLAVERAARPLQELARAMSAQGSEAMIAAQSSSSLAEQYLRQEEAVFASGAGLGGRFQTLEDVVRDAGSTHAQAFAAASGYGLEEAAYSRAMAVDSAGAEILRASSSFASAIDVARSMSQPHEHARSMVETAREMRHLAGGFGALRGGESLAREMRSLGETARALQDLGSMRIAENFERSLRDYDSGSLATYAMDVERLHRHAITDVGFSGADFLQTSALTSLRGVAAATMAAQSPFERLGILQMTDAVAPPALTWATRSDSSLGLGMAILPLPVESSSKRRPARLDVQVEVTCACCGDPLISAGEQREWRSEQSLMLKLPFFPWCPRCLRDSGGDLQLLLDKLCGGARPEFALVPVDGDGEGDGVPHGRLRLVRHED